MANARRMPEPILTDEEERAALGETPKPEADTSWYRGFAKGSGDYDEFMSARDPAYREDRRQATADEGFDRYLRQYRGTGDMDQFMADRGGAMADDEMSADELRQLLGGHQDVMAGGQVAAATPTPEQQARNAQYGTPEQRAYGAQQMAQQDPQSRWMAAYAATMARMGVPEEYWRTSEQGAPQTGTPYAPVAQYQPRRGR